MKVIAGVCGGAGSYTRFLPVFGRAGPRNDLLYSAVTEGCIGSFFHTWRIGHGAPLFVVAMLAFMIGLIYSARSHSRRVGTLAAATMLVSLILVIVFGFAPFGSM